MNEDTRTALAEFVGTFILVFIGAGAGTLGSGGIVGVALAHGLALMVIIYAVGSMSGAHVNPAVTFGAALSGKITWLRAVWYWAAQLVGAVAAAALVRFIFSGKGGDFGITTLTEGVTALQGVLVELFLTLFLVLAVIMSGLRGKNGNLVGVAIGLVLTMDILMGGALTGASMNPARTLGPAIVNVSFANVWIYLVGPLLGAAAAVGVASLLPESAPAAERRESRPVSRPSS